MGVVYQQCCGRMLVLLVYLIEYVRFEPGRNRSPFKWQISIEVFLPLFPQKHR